MNTRIRRHMATQKQKGTLQPPQTRSFCVESRQSVNCPLSSQGIQDDNPREKLGTRLRMNATTGANTEIDAPLCFFIGCWFCLRSVVFAVLPGVFLHLLFCTVPCGSHHFCSLLLFCSLFPAPSLTLCMCSLLSVHASSSLLVLFRRVHG